MIYNSQFKIQDLKKGQIILLALLIMAVVLVVALAIGTLMVRELKMAANIARSATAYYAAESGLEEALWKAWKNPPLPDLPYGKDLAILGAKWDWTKREAPSDEFENRHLERDKSEQIYFPLGEPDISEVKSVKFTQWDVKPPDTISWLEYKTVSWPNAITFDPSQIETNEGLLDAPENVCINLNPEGNYDRLFRFKPLHGGVTYTLEGYENTNCGTKVPTIGGGKLEVISTGSYAKVKRNLSIVFYPRPPLHGIFDYVLFSDEDIKK